MLHTCTLVGPYPVSLNKFTIGLHNTFNSTVEQSAGIGHNGLVQTDHDLSDLGLEGCFSVVRMFVYFPLTNAP